MRKRKISLWMTCCYYPSCKHSHSALVHYTLFEMLDVFSLYVTAEFSVASINMSVLVGPIASSPPDHDRHSPHRRRHRHVGRGLHLIFNKSHSELLNLFSTVQQSFKEQKHDIQFTVVVLMCFFRHIYKFHSLALAQNVYRWRALVNAAMNFRVPHSAGNFLTSWEPLSFSRTPLHSVTGLQKFLVIPVGSFF